MSQTEAIPGNKENKNAQVPDDLKQLRACLYCSLIQTWEQFESFGCANCEAFMKYKGNKHKIGECTSSSFEGLISMMDPNSSWVARWQRINGPQYARGVYAISVNGKIPHWMSSEIETETGKKYHPRSK